MRTVYRVTYWDPNNSSGGCRSQDHGLFINEPLAKLYIENRCDGRTGPFGMDAYSVAPEQVHEWLPGSEPTSVTQEMKREAALHAAFQASPIEDPTMGVTNGETESHYWVTTRISKAIR